MKRIFMQSKIVNTFVLLVFALIYSGGAMAETISWSNGSTQTIDCGTTYTLTASNIKGRNSATQTMRFHSSKTACKLIIRFTACTLNGNKNSNRDQITLRGANSSRSFTNNTSGYASITYTTNAGTDLTFTFTGKSNSNCSWTATIETVDCVCCPEPTSLNVTDITGSSATVSWNGTAGSYNMRIVRYSDFDAGSKDGWTTIDADGDGYDWVLGSAADGIYLEGVNFAGTGHNSSADMIISGSYSNISGVLTPDNYLVSPRINLGPGASISFWAKGQEASYFAEHFGVAVSTTGNASASNFTMVSTEYVATNDWVQYTVDLSAYSGQGYVAIRHYNVSDQFILGIDDILIVEGSSFIAGVTSPYSLTGLSSNNTYTVQIQSDCGDDNYSDWAGTSFTTVCGSITDFPYTEGFEDGIPLCWTMIDNDEDGLNWMASTNPQIPAHSGNSVAMSQSYNSSVGAIDADNWLITQAIDVPADGEYIAEWWAAIQDVNWADTYSVYIATSNSISAFELTTPILSEYAPGNEFEKHAVSLAAYAGQTIYIAFRHHVEDMFYIKIDDFAVYAAPTGEYEIELTSVAPNNNTRVVAGEPFDIEGVVTNNGARINSYVVTYTIDGGAPFVQNINGIDVSNGGTHNFTLADISLTAGRHTIVVTISEPNGEDDGYVLDNSKTIAVNAINCTDIVPPYAEYFSNDINPCWTNRGWVYRNGFAASNSYGTSVDNWLISPKIIMPDNEDDAEGYIAQWAVYAFSPTGTNTGNNYQVYVSTAGTDVSDFVQVFTHTPEVPNSSNYTDYNTYIREIDLSSYYGQEIYIAFRNETENQYIIGIDEFKVYDACDISIKTLPYVQSFSMDLPGCWHQIHDNINPMGVVAGEFKFNSHTPSVNYNQYLITPEIDLPTDLFADGIPLVLEFNYKGESNEEFETFAVMTSTTDNDVEHFVEQEEITTTSSGIVAYSLQLDANTKYIAINYRSQDKWYLYIDDFVLSLKSEIALESTTPSDDSYVFVGDDFTISGVIRNLSSTLTSYIVSYTVDGGEPVEYEVEGIEIPYKETHSFTHPTPISLTAGEHTIVVTISDPNYDDDFNLTNNSTTILVTAYACTPHSDDDQSAIDASDHKVRVWTGLAGSSDWNTAGNWLQYNGTKYSVAGTLSNNTTNVFIVALDNCVTASASNTANIADGNTATVKNLNIGTGKTLSMGSSTLNVAGDFTNNGTFDAGTGTVVFDGSDTQTISSASALAFNSITFNNSNGINLGVAPIINGAANFTSGVVTGNVTFGTAGSSEGASRTSYVNGTVTKTGNDASFTFPTGSDGVLGTITATIGSGSWVSAKYNHNSADNGDGTHGFTTDVIPRWWNAADMCGNADERFDHVSNFEYWDVSSPVELSDVTLVSEAISATEHFNSTSAYVNNDIQVAAYTNGCWKNFEGSAVISGADHNVITITGATIPKDPHRAAADFLITLGSKSKNTVLPIELTSFTATCDGRSALVEWTTASERNNDYFSLERSDDAINFTEIARVAGAGNSIEQIDYSYTDYGIHGGDNYYRLVQVDYDGTRTVSEVIVANCIEPEVGEPDVLAYPNPFNGELTLVLDNFSNRAATIEVYDMLGKLIYTEKASAPQNSYETILNLSNLPSGAYTVRVSTTDFVINKNVVKQ